MLVNFSWLVPNQIAGAGQIGGYNDHPEDGQEELLEDLALLREQGVLAIVSLTEEPLNEKVLRAKGLAYLHLPIMDMQPPKLEDIIQFIDFVKFLKREERPVVVHCGAGMGRTGTMLACYLVGQGYSFQDALAQVRQRRPGSVETLEQEDVIQDYAEYLTAFSNGKKPSF